MRVSPSLSLVGLVSKRQLVIVDKAIFAATEHTQQSAAQSAEVAAAAQRAATEVTQLRAALARFSG